MKKTRVLIVVPAYNEEASLARVVKDIQKQSHIVDIVVIDDGSTDTTATIARGLPVQVIQLSKRSGVGEAVRQGLLYAKAHDWDVAIQIDADGEHDPKFVPLLLAQIQKGTDVAIGSRFLRGRVAQVFVRGIGRKVCMLLINVLFRKDIHDPTSGFRAFNRRAISFLSSGYPKDFPEPESLVMLYLQRFKVTEVPVVVRSRFGGTSSITFWKSMYLGVRVPVGMLFQYIRGRFFL